MKLFLPFVYIPSYFGIRICIALDKSCMHILDMSMWRCDDGLMVFAGNWIPRFPKRYSYQSGENWRNKGGDPQMTIKLSPVGKWIPSYGRSKPNIYEDEVQSIFVCGVHIIVNSSGSNFIQTIGPLLVIHIIENEDAWQGCGFLENLVEWKRHRSKFELGKQPHSQ